MEKLHKNRMAKKLSDGGQQKNNEYSPSDDYIQHFYTFDLGAATSLVTAGFELASLDKVNPRKVQFIFRRADGIEKAVSDYWADRLEVKARAFFDNAKMLKNRIYSE